MQVLHTRSRACLQDAVALNVLPTPGTPGSGSLFLASPHTRSYATLPPAPPLSPAQSSVPSMAPSYLDYVDGHDGSSLPSIALFGYDGASNMSHLSGPRTGASMPSGPLAGYSLTPPQSFPMSRGGKLAHGVRPLSPSGTPLWAQQHAAGAAGPSSLSNPSQLSSYVDAPLPAPVSRRRGNDDETKASAARLRPLQALAPLRMRPVPQTAAAGAPRGRAPPLEDESTRVTSLSTTMSSVGMQPPAYVFPLSHDNPSFQPSQRRTHGAPPPQALQSLASQDDLLHLQRSPAPVAVGKVCEPAWPSLQQAAGCDAAGSNRVQNGGNAAPSLEGDRSVASHLPRSSSSVPRSRASAPSSLSQRPVGAHRARYSSGALDALRMHGAHAQPGPWDTSEAAALLLACEPATTARAPPRGEAIAAQYAMTPPERSAIPSLPESGHASPPRRSEVAAAVESAALSVTLHRTLDAQGCALATRTSMRSAEHDTISEYTGFLNVPQSFLDPATLHASPATAAGDPSAHFGDSTELSRHVAVHGTPRQHRKQTGTRRQHSSPRGCRHATEGPSSQSSGRVTLVL